MIFTIDDVCQQRKWYVRAASCEAVNVNTAKITQTDDQTINGACEFQLEGAALIGLGGRSVVWSSLVALWAQCGIYLDVAGGRNAAGPEPKGGTAS